MSNVAKNELENLKNDLKNSIENLESELEKIKTSYTEWRSHDLGMAAMKRDLIRWELARQERELAILDYLIAVYETTEVRVNIPDEYSKDAKSYWEIAENWMKHPTVNTTIEGVGIVVR